jgi:hypothetical protein
VSATKPTAKQEPELHADAWSRFERAVDVAAKAAGLTHALGYYQLSPRGMGEGAYVSKGAADRF